MGVESYIIIPDLPEPLPDVLIGEFAYPPFSEAVAQSFGWLPTDYPSALPLPELIEGDFVLPSPSDFAYAFFQYIDVVSGDLPPLSLPFDYESLSAIAPIPVDTSLPVVIPPVACDLTLGDLRARLATRLDDEGFVYYTTAEVTRAINWAERLFCFLTLCNEKTATFTLTNGQTFYEIDSQFTDFIAPLRVDHLVGGVRTRLRSDTIHNLDLRDNSWRSRAGNPTRYAWHGTNLLAITRQPSSGANTLSITYAAEPAEMSASSAVPTVQSEQQPHLEDGAYFYLRLKEGGAEMQSAMQYLTRFLDAAQKYGGFTRAKARAQGYDRMPFDLETFDRSAFERWLRERLRKQQQMERQALSGGGQNVREPS